jgi:hypothetical protein
MDELNPSRFGTTWNEKQFDGKTAFKNMQAAFHGAIAKHPDELHESFYIFGGRRVRLRVVGRDLAEHFRRPFSHLRTDDRNPEAPRLTIEIWDHNKATIDGEAPLTSDDLCWTETTVKSMDKRFIGQQLPHTVSCLDRDAGHIVASIAWNNKIFIYERAKPLARLLLEWHNDQDFQVIHTGLVARDGKGVLFAGRSGSGKSTSSLACISSGFDYLGEDYVALEHQQDGAFVGHSLYNSVFLDTVHLTRFSELSPCAIKGRLPHEEKSVIILSQIFPERLKRAVPIQILALLRVAHTPQPKFRPASKGEALLALGPSSLLQIPNRGLGVRGFKKLAQLVEQVPCYWLEVAGDLRSIADGVDELLAQVSSS